MTTIDPIDLGSEAALLDAGVLAIKQPLPIAVMRDEHGALVALDDRCPHLGFPLSEGSCKDGLVTCNFHHARFDMHSGCTFDLFADDLTLYPVEVVNGRVLVTPEPLGTGGRGRLLDRLRDGLDHDIGYVIAKSIAGLLAEDDGLQTVREAVLDFACERLDGVADGVVSLGAVLNLWPVLSESSRFHALATAVRRIADNAAGQPPRARRAPLTGVHDAEQLDRWLTLWSQGRHRDGIERVLLTRLAGGADATAEVARLQALIARRVFSNTGHTFDFMTKAGELVAHSDQPRSRDVLAMMAGAIANARGAEEGSDWRQPVDLIALAEEAVERLPTNVHGTPWEPDEAEIAILLGDDPAAIAEALIARGAAGCGLADLSRVVAYTAGLRLARFPTSNDPGDWFMVQHTCNYTDAVDRALTNAVDVVAADADIGHGLRAALIHGAFAVYQDRALNLPPARLADERRDLDALPRNPEELRKQLLTVLDTRGQEDQSARIVARYLQQEHPAAALVDTLTLAWAREDLDFHSLQLIDAGWHQYQRWNGGTPGARILIGVVRNLAAHCPTRRRGFQLHRTAWRLQRD